MARKAPIRQDAIVAAFAEKLRQARHARGMTQRDLARVTHLAESYISRLENGAIAPGIDLVARIARALAIPIEDLLRQGEAASDQETLAVARDQAKHLLESILKSQDPAFVFLVVQILAMASGAAERQR